MDGDASTLGTLERATREVLAAADALDADGLARPSLLSRWSRAHVLTHLSRNADSHIRLIDGLAQYPSAAYRNADIEAGARQLREPLLADLHASAARLARRWAEVTDWSADRAADDPRPRRVLITERLLEVEVHHLDLDVGYTSADWAPSFIGALLDDASAKMSDGEPLRLVADDGPGTWIVGGGAGVAEVRGPVHLLAAWLIGRATGDGLTVTGGGPVPTPPAWR